MSRATVVVDIDGTLANCSHRLHFIESQPKNWDAFFDNCDKDELIRNVQLIVVTLRQSFDLVFVSGRAERARAKTVAWLEKYGLSGPLFMRRDGDHRPDDIVKSEIYERHLKDLTIVAVLDDRDRVVDMWRSKGLTCLQVAKGEF
jgi:hypothetical protein